MMSCTHIQYRRVRHTDVIYIFGPTARNIAGDEHSNIAATLRQRCSATFKFCTATIL